MSEIRAIVVYCSRSGNTKTVAEEIARAIGADIEEIRDTAKRRGLIGYMRCGREGMRKMTTVLAAPGRNVSGYDLVIVGGPIWAGSMSSPVRTWLRAHAAEIHHAAFFLTHGGTARDAVLAEMASASRLRPVAELSVREGELGKAAAGERIAAFAASARHAVRSLIDEPLEVVPAAAALSATRAR